jgi:cytochrome c-type biogenesis protein CcmF
MLVAASAHFLLGARFGWPAVVWSVPIYDGVMGKMFQAFNAYTPVIGFSLVVFNFFVIMQEFFLLYRSRFKAGTEKTPTILWLLGLFPGLVYSLVSLPHTGRRRYGGYIVHLGIVLMFLGFTGKSWTVDRETTLSPNQTYQVENLTLKYLGPRMEVDTAKRMVFADVEVFDKDGKDLGKLDPAKFIYKKMPDSPTTEVSMLHKVTFDLYLVVGSINPETKVASLQIHLNPLVGWIWLGGLILVMGCFLCMWPELEPEESRVWHTVRGAGAVATSIILGVMLAFIPSTAYGQSTASQHAGSVQIDDLKEKQVFGQLRCMCGTCPRELLSTCACSTADQTRERLRGRLSKGETPEQIIKEYTDEYGVEALAIPPNRGAMRAIYAVPVVALVGTGIGLAFAMKRWRSNSNASRSKKSAEAKPEGDKRDDYDDRIDAELKDLDD